MIDTTAVNAVRERDARRDADRRPRPSPPQAVPAGQPEADAADPPPPGVGETVDVVA